MEEFRRAASGSLPEILFGVLLALAAAVLITAGSGLTFFYDEWQIVLDQSSLGHALLEPHNGQIFLLPTAVYRIIMEAFGIDTQLPFRLVAVGLASTCAVLLFVTMRRSAGSWMALVLVLPVLLLGSAWEALLLPLSMNFLISLASGLGALLLLERADRAGDVGACLLLSVAIGAGGLGLAFLAGALVSILFRGEPKRFWIVGLPILLVLVWVLQHDGQASAGVTLVNLKGLPGYVFHAASSVAGSATGLSAAWRPISSLAATVDRILVCLVMVAVALRVLVVRAPVSKRALTLVMVLLAFWLLAGLVTGAGREPQASRYQYPGVVLALAAGAALLSGVSTPRLLPLFCLPLALFSLHTNLELLNGGRAFLSDQTAVTRSVLETLEVDHAADLPELNAGAASGEKYLDLVTAGPYLKAVNQHGSPVVDPVQVNSITPDAASAAAWTSIAIRWFRVMSRL